MRLIKINHEDVDPESGVTHNSNFHSEEEAKHLTIPTEGPTSFGHWLPLIAASQAIPSNLIQTITLTASQGRLLIAASQSSLHTREPNRMLEEELTSDIGPALKTLVFPPEGLFLRLDACSPKDGVDGRKPLRDLKQILLRLTTSHRAMNAIIRLLDMDTPITLYFLPFNIEMNTALEYRVFCPPSSAEVAAISQYKWHTQSIFHDRSDDEIVQIAKTVMEEVRRIHANIMGCPLEERVAKLLRSQGFTFDVMFREKTQSCALIELNTFGSRSGCGSCLFHWLRDEDVLYGRRPKNENGKVEVEFRISV
jgi:hypothetical protein